MVIVGLTWNQWFYFQPCLIIRKQQTEMYWLGNIAKASYCVFVKESKAPQYFNLYIVLCLLTSQPVAYSIAGSSGKLHNNVYLRLLAI